MNHPSLPVFSATPLKVSTMTAHVKTGVNIDYRLLFNIMPLIPYWAYEEGALKIKHGGVTRGTADEDVVADGKPVRASKKPQPVPVTGVDLVALGPAGPATHGELGARHKKQRGCVFMHQTTIVFRVNLSEDTTKAAWKEVNIKVFSNGSLQMSGFKSEAVAVKAQRALLAQLNALNDEYDGRLFTFMNASALECAGLGAMFGGLVPEPKRMVEAPVTLNLINCDFMVPFPIRREELHRIIINRYHLFATFESTEYQGVKISYYWNGTGTLEPGVCNCKTRCIKGDGTGFGENQCQCITIAVFRTGKVIITGARRMCQVEEAYAFMTALLRDNMAAIYRYCLAVPEPAVPSRKAPAPTMRVAKATTIV